MSLLARHQSSFYCLNCAFNHTFDIFDASLDPHNIPIDQPKMKSMFMLGNVRVLPVVPADAPAMVDVMDSAFAPTFHYQQMYPYGDVPEEDRSKRIELMQKTIESDEHAKLFKAVLIDDEGGDAFVNGVEVAVECEVNGKRSNGVESEKRKYKDAKDITLLPEKIVGWAKWRMYYEERPVENSTEKKMEKDIEGMNVEYANWFWGTMDGNRRKLFGGMPLASEYISNSFRF